MSDLVDQRAPDPTLRAWFIFFAIFTVGVVLLRVVFVIALIPLWEAAGVDEGRAISGTQLLAWVFSLPLSYVCFRLTVRRFFVPRPAQSHQAISKA